MTTASTSGGPNGPTAEHIDVDELADAAEDLIAVDRRRQIDAHLAWCQDCRATAQALAEVQELLAADPAVPMPDAVFTRLQAGLDAEERNRQTDRSRQSTRPLSGPGAPLTADPYGSGPSYADSKFRPDRRRASHPATDAQELGADGSDQEGDPAGGAERSARRRSTRATKPWLAEHFNQTLGARTGLRAKLAGGAVGAALLATAVGFGGYLVSSSAGAAEPPADRPIMVDQSSLQASAAAAAKGDLDPYRFTRAWNCARKVTDGDITGIRSTVLDQRSGYLVFIKDSRGNRAVFVSGCDTGSPTAGPTVDVGRR